MEAAYDVRGFSLRRAATRLSAALAELAAAASRVGDDPGGLADLLAGIQAFAVFASPVTCALRPPPATEPGVERGMELLSPAGRPLPQSPGRTSSGFRPSPTPISISHGDPTCARTPCNLLCPDPSHRGRGPGRFPGRARRPLRKPRLRPLRPLPSLPRVLVVATGGTIAAAGYAGQKQLTSEDRPSRSVPQLREVAQISAEDPVTVGSSQFTPQMLLDLVRHVRKTLAADPGLAGIVVTQGTDSLEETALFFDLLLATDRPVVFTAAMRLPTEIGSDGPRNLLNAVRIAASPAARGLGVLVTLNDEIHAAREVRKTHSSAVDAFQSTGSGPIGYVDEGEIYLMRKPLRRVTIDTDAIEPRVNLVVATVGSDGHQIKAALDAGARGIVLELFGRGNIPGPMVAEIREALKNHVTLVFTTRAAGGGRVLVGPVCGRPA